MKKIFILCCMCVFLMTKTAWADLSVSPFYVVFDADSPKRTASVRFTNNSAEEKRYRIKLINYRQMPDGRYEEITKALKGNPFAAPYINYAPHEATLKPRQSQTIRLQRKPMAAAADGEYVSHLLIQEMPQAFHIDEKTQSNELKFDIKALYGVTIPIIIDKGNLTDKGWLENVKLLPGSDELLVTVGRSGTKSFWGNIIVLDKYKEIGRVNELKIFLTTDKRSIRIPLTQKPGANVKVILEDARTNKIISEKTI